ncbi:hypothetical protein DUNSADRAFT_17675 [Dunaliella salina]|uniref:Encoded protein n=1 Tax=Dunaliella salina TaxID=3046 RepID=A0ABQ7G1A9_DUNSA|nr:hypothetical protein DUNSADRAFT_17675 [Dunaliella salina]|eukprot:KAF5828389.1 hypothetical protein DUNSADRAFT_17675 [Dunaliella salina]
MSQALAHRPQLTSASYLNTSNKNAGHSVQAPLCRHPSKHECCCSSFSYATKLFASIQNFQKTICRIAKHRLPIDELLTCTHWDKSSPDFDPCINDHSPGCLVV